MKRFMTLVAAGSVALTVSSAMAGTCGAQKTAKSYACENATKANVTLASMTTYGAPDIVDTAVSAGSFKTLAAALDAADLIGTLKGDGPFTVFAPTDEAFAKLPHGTVEQLLKPENKAMLAAILTYHVVPGNVMAKDVVTLTTATTLNGQRIDISLGKGVKVDNANVTKTDIACANGVIHVIDRVIMPSTDNLIETAVNAGSFETLAAAVKTAGLAGVLSGDGPFTVFAPTDAAFAKLPAGTVESLLQPNQRHQLIDILKYHVVRGRIYAKDALNAQTAETVEGSRLRFGLTNNLRVNGANVLNADLETSNGVIHVIDQVLIPGS